MKKNVKTKDVLNVHRIISSAKYTKMEDADKIKVWKIARALNPTAVQFDEDMKDAQEKLKPEGDFDGRMNKAVEFERLRNAGEPAEKVMSDEEYNGFISEFKAYEKTVNEAVAEFGDKDVEVEFEPLTEEAFGRLMASNEWTVQQASLVGDFVCE